MDVTDEDLVEVQAEMPERRRLEWVGVKPGRAIQQEGEHWVALERGREVNHHRFLSGLMDLLPEDR